MKKKIFILFLLITVSGCGFSPINSLDNNNYSIISFKLNGDNQVNKIIKKNFDRYKNIDNQKKIFDINLTSKLIKNTNSKNKSGGNSNLSIKILIDLEIIENTKNREKISFSEISNYNSLENKFELKQYEKIITNDLTKKILNKIHLKLSVTE